MNNSTNIRQTSASVVKEGSVIGYLLPGSRRLIWHGRILRTIHEARCVLVESTEPGYEGMTEYVMVEFILPAEQPVLVSRVLP